MTDQPKLDLDELEAVARVSIGLDMGEWMTADDVGHYYEREDAEYIARMDPPTALAMIARVRELETFVTDLAHDKIASSGAQSAARNTLGGSWLKEGGAWIHFAGKVPRR